jgi:NAD-dependent dihydropyrimidine dehydrogenase PreA subunit
MIREIIKIDEEKCNGCGLCIPECHEGALQIIDGKARLISELMCDGLGACIGHCPEGAMEIEVREARPYDEVVVMKEMVTKGKNVVIAHMKHLKDHGEFSFLKQAVGFLMENQGTFDFDAREVISEVHFYKPGKGSVVANGKTANLSEEHSNGIATGTAAALLSGSNHGHGSSKDHPAFSFPRGGGCPGSRSVSFDSPGTGSSPDNKIQEDERPELTQWPVQMHLINPAAAHFRDADLLLAADCVAYSVAGFHSRFLKGKKLAIACPKLDVNKEVYVDKLVSLVTDARINTLTVMKMEVPCCFGIEQMAVQAVQLSGRKVPVKSITVGIKGEILDEQWL